MKQQARGGNSASGPPVVNAANCEIYSGFDLLRHSPQAGALVHLSPLRRIC